MPLAKLRRPPKTVRKPQARPTRPAPTDPRTEGLLRELAFVLAATRSVRRAMMEEAVA
jgi:hypothetical protein